MSEPDYREPLYALAARAREAERLREENEWLKCALLRALDSCFCDDGRGEPECLRCVEIRIALGAKVAK